MKLIIPVLLVLGLFLNLSFTFGGGNYFQVISSHPHDLELIEPYISTVEQNGRLWVVKVKAYTPKFVFKHLRKISGYEKSYFHKPVFFTFGKLRTSTDISERVESVSKENIRDEIVRLASYETRAVGSKDNEDAIKMAYEKLHSFGYEVKKVCYSPKACSIVADKIGTSRPDQVLMVMGHIDSVGETFAGADDNASGTSVLLEMARVLKDYSNSKTIRFFITNGEESGTLGASHYARLLANKDELKKLELVVNMDMVGYNSNGVVELETDPKFEQEAKWYADIAYRFTNLVPKISLGAWGSDHVPFLRRGVNSILVIENWDTKSPCYHQECDTPETINYDYATEIGKLNVAAILSKDLL